MARLIGRLSDRSDPELEQAVARVTLAIGILAFFGAYSYGLQSRLETVVPGMVLAGAFLGLSLAYLGGLLIAPPIGYVRRVVANAMDHGTLSLLMFWYGEPAVPLYIGTLAVIMDNGLRYGRADLFLSWAFALAAFTTVITTSSFWQGSPTLAWGLLAGLVVLPLYPLALLAKLNRARAEADAANRAKGQLLASMNHEIQTPMNGVISMVDLLQETSLSPMQRHFTETIRSSAKALLELMEHVLDLSKIETKKLVGEISDFDLYATVKEVVAMLRSEAEAKGLRLEIHIDPHTPYQVRGDDGHVRQILINLVKDAVAFTERGRVVVRVSPAAGGEGEIPVCFEVVDTGNGMLAEAQRAVFEVPLRADASVAGHHGATGLGTVISRQLTDALGGSMEVESVPDVGTSFAVTLPLGRPEAGPEETALTSGGRVLLVSRDRALIRTLSGWLPSWGLGLEVVDGTDQCLDRLQGEAAGLGPVLMDEGAFLDPMGFLSCFTSPYGDKGPALVLLRRDPASDRLRKLEDRFSMVLDLPPQKPVVFNALYALQHDGPGDTRVVELARHCRGQGQAESAGHVLVAEDNAINQEVIRLILEKGGYRATLVSDGEAALDALETNAFDLALVDMHMPGRSGLELVRMHRPGNNDGQGIPFVLLTANASRCAVRQSEEAGVDAYLTKPVRARRLLDTVNGILGPAGEAVPAAEQEEPAEVEPKPTACEVTPDGPLVSDPILRELAGLTSDPSFMSGLVQDFLHDAEKLRAGMDEAARAERLEELQKQAHTLKGSAANLGVEAVANVCGRLQHAGAADLADGTVRSDLDRLADLLQRARPLLLAYASNRLGG